MKVFVRKQADKSSDGINPIIAQTYVSLCGFIPVASVYSKITAKGRL